MKKNAIAMGLMLLPVAAMADVTLYGQMKGAIGAERMRTETMGVKNNSGKGGQSTDTMVRDYGSRIGFKGQEDLGNGLKTIWQVEQTVSLAGNTSTGWSNRETFLGLKGDFGTVRVGNLRTVFDADMRDADPWEYDYDGGKGYNGLSYYERVHTPRIAASVRYDTPNIAGFSANIHLATGANRAASGFKQQDDNGNQSNKGSDVMYLGLNYENSGFFAKYGFGMYKKSTHSANVTYDNNGNRHENIGNKSAQVHRLNVGYKANGLLVAGSWQYADGFDSLASHRNRFGVASKDVNLFTSGANNIAQASGSAAEQNRFNDYLLASQEGAKRHEAVLTASYTMGAWTPRASYVHGFDMKSKGNYGKFSNTKYDQVIVGADYALSKRTTMLLTASWMKQGLGTSYSSAVQNGQNVIVEHKDQYQVSALALGMRHLF